MTVDGVGDARLVALDEVLDATGVGFMDNLPTDMLIADPANASTNCTGQTLAKTARACSALS